MAKQGAGNSTMRLARVRADFVYEDCCQLGFITMVCNSHSPEEKERSLFLPCEKWSLQRALRRDSGQETGAYLARIMTKQKESMHTSHTFCQK